MLGLSALRGSMNFNMLGTLLLRYAFRGLILVSLTAPERAELFAMLSVYNECRIDANELQSKQGTATLQSISGFDRVTNASFIIFEVDPSLHCKISLLLNHPWSFWNSRTICYQYCLSFYLFQSWKDLILRCTTNSTTWMGEVALQCFT